jgi:hypothetical protein
MGLFDAARDAEGRPKANKLVRVASGFRPDDLVLTDSPDSHSPARNGIGGLYGPPAETLTVTSAGASVNLAISPLACPTAADAAVATSSALPWPTGLSCRSYLRRTSRLSPQDAIKWMALCGDISMRTFVIGS